MTITFRKKMWIGLFGLALFFISSSPNQADANGELMCGAKKFVFEKGFFSSSVTQAIGNKNEPFCVSKTPETVTKELSFRDLEVWCVTKYRVSSNSRPVAKNVWILSERTNKLYQYDYLFSGGAWLLQDEHYEICDIVVNE